MDKKFIQIKYGDSSQGVYIESHNIAWEIAPSKSKALDDLHVAIQESIRNPIGSEPLQRLVKKYGKKTILIVDDNTRATPQKDILPVLINELNCCGVDDENIIVLIALGTHRPMTKEECIERFGSEVVERIKVVNLSGDEKDFAYIGKTQSGIPVSVAKLFLESDLSIAIGNIIPHMYAGWSGGAKMIQPGITDKSTTAHTHLMAADQVFGILGEAENPVRHEMEEIAMKTGLKFIVNVVLNGDNEVVDVVSGDMIKAHRQGVESAKHIYCHDIPFKADIVIAGSYPADRDLWQGFKPLNNCGMMVKDGGFLILVIPAPEGIAPDHPELVELGLNSEQEVKEMLRQKKITDGVAAATYMAFSQTRSRIRIMLVSDGIQKNEAEKIGVGVYSELSEALSDAIKRTYRNAKIGIVHHGADVLPRINNI